jgi:hypothetical protein
MPACCARDLDLIIGMVLRKKFCGEPRSTFSQDPSGRDLGPSRENTHVDEVKFGLNTTRTSTQCSGWHGCCRYQW